MITFLINIFLWLVKSLFKHQSLTEQNHPSSPTLFPCPSYGSHHTIKKSSTDHDKSKRQGNTRPWLPGQVFHNTVNLLFLLVSPSSAYCNSWAAHFSIFFLTSQYTPSFKTIPLNRFRLF